VPSVTRAGEPCSWSCHITARCVRPANGAGTAVRVGTRGCGTRRRTAAVPSVTRAGEPCSRGCHITARCVRPANGAGTAVRVGTRGCSARRRTAAVPSVTRAGEPCSWSCHITARCVRPANGAGTAVRVGTRHASDVEHSIGAARQRPGERVASSARDSTRRLISDCYAVVARTVRGQLPKLRRSQPAYGASSLGASQKSQPAYNTQQHHHYCAGERRRPLSHWWVATLKVCKVCRLLPPRRSCRRPAHVLRLSTWHGSSSVGPCDRR
jgi:hypothetical protein